ncbi:hypothetical protein C8A01DRAFT_41634 [Parachaetomium inaequale]|uniref:Uncharacterized protein n=1 Tax=Parachaetomium inaequale TaxID=2588326 RepID=A0AAN6P537_9PEZI|nr:hypothetical protein C8A01DRAFT_41634 [Parachaetomium inaequale]
MSDKMIAALDDLEESAGMVMAWLRYENEYWRPTSSVEGNQSWQAIGAMCDACSAARKDLGHTHKEYSWHNLGPHAAGPLNHGYSEHRLQFEEDIWGFHPDEDDLGQYDGMDLVGRVNRDEATDLNRSAAIFLASLHSKHLPDLLKYHHCDSPYHTPPEEFAIVKARPGWLRRAVLRAKGLHWEYPCRQEAIFNDDDNANKANEGRYMYGWQDGSPAWRRSSWKHDDYYFYASAWPSALAAHRIVQEKVLPMVRESQAALAEAEALYQSTVVEAGKKLDVQMRELLAGRGWEVVEEAQIGTTPGGHLVEVSRAKDMADSLVDIHNVTMWRRMVLPMGKRAVEQLKRGRRKLAGW